MPRLERQIIAVRLHAVLSDSRVMHRRCSPSRCACILRRYCRHCWSTVGAPARSCASLSANSSARHCSTTTHRVNAECARARLDRRAVPHRAAHDWIRETPSMSPLRSDGRRAQARWSSVTQAARESVTGGAVWARRSLATMSAAACPRHGTAAPQRTDDSRTVEARYELRVDDPRVAIRYAAAQATPHRLRTARAVQTR